MKKGVCYPAVLMLTGANDPRVEPMQSRKMIARLQAAQSCDAPILLRTSSDTGHGMGTPLAEQINQAVDVYAFLFDQWDVKFKAGGAPIARHCSPRRCAGLLWVRLPAKASSA